MIEEDVRQVGRDQTPGRAAFLAPLGILRDAPFLLPRVPRRAEPDECGVDLAELTVGLRQLRIERDP